MLMRSVEYFLVPSESLVCGNLFGNNPVYDSESLL